LLTLTLGGLFGKYAITSIEISDDWNHFYCGSENNRIRVFNREILNIRTEKKLKNIPMYQEYEGHSGPIKKLIFTNKNLITLSNNNDGFFIWRSKGSHTQRVREET